MASCGGRESERRGTSNVTRDESGRPRSGDKEEEEEEAAGAHQEPISCQSRGGGGWAGWKADGSGMSERESAVWRAGRSGLYVQDTVARARAAPGPLVRFGPRAHVSPKILCVRAHSSHGGTQRETLNALQIGGGAEEDVSRRGSLHRAAGLHGKLRLF